MEQPIFYLEGEIVKIRTRDNEAVKWREIESNAALMKEMDPNFLKRLYVVAKVDLIIEEFGAGVNLNQAVNFAFLELESELGDVNENIWRNKSKTIQEFKNMIEETLNNFKKQKIIYDEWAIVKSTFHTTPFVLNKINHQTEIPNLLNQNELMVFDSIKLSNIVVGCFYQDLVKYNQEYTDLINDYLNQDKMLSKKLRAADIIRLMLNIKELNLASSRTKYKMMNVLVTDNTIAFTIDTLINEPNVANNLKNLIKSILHGSEMEEAYSKKEEKEFFYGSYTASINVPVVVLKDLFTNDPNVYNIGYINESALINTRKTNLNVYLKNDDGISSAAGINIMERPDIGTTIVRLKKVQGGIDLETRINSYSKVVNKILKYASGKSDSILTYYQKYINLKVETQQQPQQPSVEDKENMFMLKNQAPEIFLPNYTRLCNKPPIIINDDDESEILEFPIYGESDLKRYKCPYEDFRYPGLRENTKLPNKSVFPFVPCCYQRPQGANKNMKMYYNQEIYEQRINSGEIGKTLKILSPRRIGALPLRIDKLLNYVTNTKYYRYGIPLSKVSCLTVLSMVANKNESEQNVRLELAKRAELCKGEFTFLTIKEITKKIMDTNTYINPRYFKGALEDYYQISYILFSKDEDDFSTYPNKFVKFVCSLRKRVIFLIEHETREHVELIVDEETLNYVNRQGKSPIFAMERNDFQVKKIFSMYKERFGYHLFDIDKKQFVDLKDVFQTYPWEYTSPNGKVLKHIEPLNQYIDGYGQTRLVEFQYQDISFVGQFQPLPCLRLPIKKLDHFISINSRLTPRQLHALSQQFTWCHLYNTRLNISDGYVDPYYMFKKLKKLAEYILWAACHVYSALYADRKLSADEWIEGHTRVVDGFTYSAVTIRPVFVISELVVDGKFIFSSVELRERIRFNLSLISPVNLKMYEINIYRAFFNDVENFNVVYPAQLALTKQDYFQRTRQPYVLNKLTSRNLQYLKTDALYFIKSLFGQYSNILCMFLSSFEKLVETANRLLWKVVLDETIMNVGVFNQNTIQQYVIGHSEPSIDIINININETWFYGLVLPNFI